MAYILNIDTATSVCSVSIAENGKLIAIKESSDEKSHSSMLTVFIEEILNKAGIKIENIDAVAVSGGPGSYTGLRIGVSAAKGICYGLNIPLISVDNLYALATFEIEKINNVQKNALFCPMIDARRMEVYCQIVNGNNEIIKDTFAEIITEESFAEFSEEKIYYFGNGAEKCMSVLDSKKFELIPNIVNSSEKMIKISYEKFLNKQFENLAYYEPFYLKDFVAKPSKQLL